MYKGPGKRGRIGCRQVVAHDVSWAARAGKHLLRTQNVSEKNQKHPFVSAPNVGEQGWRSGESARLPPICPGSIPGPDVICGLSLLVLYRAPRGFSRVLRFSPRLKNQHLI